MNYQTGKCQSTRLAFPPPGSISAYVTPSGKRCRVVFRKPKYSQMRKRGFKTKRDAELLLAIMELDKSHGTYFDPSRSLVLLGGVAGQLVSHKI